MAPNRTGLYQTSGNATAAKAPSATERVPAKVLSYLPRRDGWKLVNGRIGGWYYRRLG